MMISRTRSSTIFNVKVFVLVLFSIVIMLLSNSAKAALVNWGDSFLLQGESVQNELNPLVLVGFNPQPEPPAILSNRQPSFDFNDLSPMQVFDLGIAISTQGNNVPLAIVDAELPNEDFLNFSFMVNELENNSNLFSINLEFIPSADILIDLDTLAFNPQPEPPAQLFSLGAVFGMGFQFTSFTPMLSVAMQVFDANSNPIAFTEIELNRVSAPANSFVVVMALSMVLCRLKQLAKISR